MKVILKQDVERLGDAGEIVDVADGYANNFLMPRNLAMKASKGAVADAEAIRASRVKREAKTLAELQEVKARLEGTTVRIEAKAGEDGTLYGSVGSTAVADAIRAASGVQVDKRKIALDKPIKHTGDLEVEVKLHRDLSATVRVEVLAAAG
jgi:large subunit ribosomal protein L9